MPPKQAAMPSPIHMLEIQRLLYTFDGALTPLLDIHNWRLPAGVHLLHGDSGSCKTTLLRILAQQLPAQALVLAVDGEPADQKQSSFWRKAVFYDDIHAPDWTTAHACQHTASAYLAQQLGQQTYPAWQRAYGELLDAFKLTPHLDKQLFMLSTGTRHKLMLTAALLSPQPLVLLDEPLAGLDWPSVEAFWYALTIRQRIPGQRVLLATATPVQDLPPLRWTRIWQLPQGEAVRGSS